MLNKQKVFLLLFRKTKEDSCSFLKKRTKRLLLPDAGSKIRDLAGKYVAFQEDDDWEVGVSNYLSLGKKPGLQAQVEPDVWAAETWAVCPSPTRHLDA